MQEVMSFPLRQKIMLSLTLVAGLLIMVVCTVSPAISQAFNFIILFYAVGVPLSLLFGSGISDLSNTRIFIVWMAIAIIQLAFSVTTNHSIKFFIERTVDAQAACGVGKYVVSYSTSSLKALFFFLVAFRLLNIVLKRKTGNSIVSTYKQSTWVNSDTGRKMNERDVLANVVLFAVVCMAAIFGY